jgi:hypothetical protein
LVRTGSLRLGNWFDEKYQICISGSDVTVHQEEISEENILYGGSSAQIVSVSENHIRIKAQIEWDDMDRLRPKPGCSTDRAAFPMGCTGPLHAHPYHVKQTSDLDAYLVGDQMSVTAKSLATACCLTPPWKDEPAYELSWRAAFQKE